jgi:hypothetical protein
MIGAQSRCIGTGIKRQKKLQSVKRTAEYTDRDLLLSAVRFTDCALAS